MLVIRNRKIFFILTAAIMAGALFSVLFFGFNASIEFTGGSIIEVRYPDGRPELSSLEGSVKSAFPVGSVFQPTGEDGLIVRTKELSTEERQVLLKALTFDGKNTVQEIRYSLVGPSIGAELRNKAWLAILLVLLAIIAYVALAFRKATTDSLTYVETRIKAWHYGIIAIVALVHDILVPTGVFAFLGSLFLDAQMDMLFVSALLAIAGYSVNDTIVIFDRVRENLRKNQEMKVKKSFEETVGDGVTQTWGRSINTSLTTLLVIIALYFLGGPTTTNFALVFGVGVIAGAYSSVFLAAPLLVALNHFLLKK